MAGLIIFDASVTQALDTAQKLDAFAAVDIAELTEAIKRLKRGATVVCPPKFATGWRAPSGTVIVFTMHFLAAFGCETATYAQAIGRAGI